VTPTTSAAEAAMICGAVTARQKAAPFQNVIEPELFSDLWSCASVKVRLQM
jgi:hypothetical protein